MPRGDNALEKYRAVLRLHPNNQQARAGLNRLVDRYLEIAREAMSKGENFRAYQRLQRAEKVLPGTERVKRAWVLWEKKSKRRVSRAARGLSKVKNAPPANQTVGSRIGTLLAAAKRDIKRNAFSRPKGNNALDKYRQVLVLEPGNEQALNGIQRLVRIYILVARRAIREGKRAKAISRLERAARIDPNAKEVQKMLTNLKSKIRRDRRRR